MRVAALYDVHGNLPALEAVLAELKDLRPDAVLFGGDLAAGPMPRETIDLVRSIEGARFVCGNCDREMLESHPGPYTGWPGAQLDEEQRRFLAAFEPGIVLDDVLYCHATPYDDEPFVTIFTPDHLASEIVGEVDQPTVVIGHSHSQFDRRLGVVRLVNAGSVGMPYENEPGAYWALVDAGEPQLRRTSYDAEAAAERMRGSGWPELEGWLVDKLLTVTSAQEHAAMLESRREP